MLHEWVLDTDPCPHHPDVCSPPTLPTSHILHPYLQQPLGAVLQDPLEVPQPLGSPVPGCSGRRVPLEERVGRAGARSGPGWAGHRLGLGQHEGVAAVAVLHAVVAPAAAALQSPALGSGSAQSRRGTGQGHEAEAERLHGSGVPAGPGCHGGGCAGSLLRAGMGQWALAAASNRGDFGISSL